MANIYEETSSLTLKEIFDTSIARSKRWHEAQEPWSRADWLVAIMGEFGELCNVAKKLRRVETKAPNINLEEGRKISDFETAKARMLEEAADFILYTPSFLASIGATADEFNEAIRKKFNQKSEEYGFPERL